MISIVLLLVLAASSSFGFGRIYYVKPNSFSSSCPAEPCLTINQYGAQHSKYFSGPGRLTLLFLQGNHSLHSNLHLRNISDIVLRGEQDSNVTILCKTEEAIRCKNVSNFTIQNMIIIFTDDGYSTAINVIDCNNVLLLYLKFQRSSDLVLVRAVSFIHSNVTIENCVFERNTGDNGGAIHVADESTIYLRGNVFVANHAQEGGAIFVNNSLLVLVGTSGNTFIQNSAVSGGALFLLYSKLDMAGKSITEATPDADFKKRMHLRGIDQRKSKWSPCFLKNTASEAGGAIAARVSSLSFTGYTLFEKNYALTEGGAIVGLVRSKVMFSGVTLFVHNNSTTEGGGAMKAAIESRIVMNGLVLFKMNNCTTGYGGAISLIRSRITLSDNITFESNWAEMGGAMYLRESTLVLKQHVTVTTSNNHARYFGGALFHEDNINYYQCNFAMNESSKEDVLYLLPNCFLILDRLVLSESNTSAPYALRSYNDSAGKDGQFLYGGLMDKCGVIDTHNNIQYGLLYKIVMRYSVFKIETNSIGTNAISSEAYTLCFCMTSEDYNCEINKTIATERGGKFNVSVLALSQGNTITSPLLLAKVSKTARLKLCQDAQNLNATCTTLWYNMYSTEEEEVLTLYPDKSCRDEGLATAVVSVNFQPCPSSSTLYSDHCVCEDRLQKYSAICEINGGDNIITRKAGSKFWMSALYSGDTYEGLILYPSCPTDYCKTKEVRFSLKDLDTQCDFNHSGMLCGACATNHSLMLGNSKCQKCSNMYILLLIAFAGAGIALVAFLSFLRLTVATGLINSIILYANIVQANKSFFFPNSAHVNILTVFIAWMNLDLGFPTCFYNGMDAYAQTWLQFAFPIYVWVLISLIIVSSQYSSIVTKLIGSNPIAVLATLLLMSYAKVLKNIIGIYASVHLEYPNTTLTVWLKDANVPYLKSKHLHLAVVGSIFITVFFFPYTFLLLLGYKLYHFSSNRYLHWFMIRMKPLLDSYYAPYEKHTRYWTGLLLLVRCALYMVFSLDSIGGTNKSLLAIITVYTILIVTAWLSVRIYRSYYVNIIEALVYTNQIVLAATVSNRANSTGLVYSLVGMVFVIMLGIILYHFHLQYIAKSALWLRMITFLMQARKKHSEKTYAEKAPLVPSTDKVTKSVIYLRESLLEEISK